MKAKFHKSDIKNGIGIIAIGLIFLLFGPFTYWRQPIPKEFGFIFIGVGLIVLLPSKRHKENYKKYESGNLRCIGCGKIYPRKNVSVLICPICDEKLEPSDESAKET